jgi:hypothetical protein
VAAGGGSQTLAAARRVGPDGRVLATDISSNILAFAERSAREAGLRNVETRVLDGEQLDVEPGTFDAVISHVGFIYFPDQHAAFVGMRLALRPGGRLAGIVYSTPEANGFFSIPVSIIRRRAQLPAPAQGQPGPFSLGAPGVIEAALERAGFTDVEARRVAAPPAATVHFRVRPLRARVLRGPAPDACGAQRSRARGGVGATSSASSHGTRRRAASRAPAICSSPRAPRPRSAARTPGLESARWRSASQRTHQADALCFSGVDTADIHDGLREGLVAVALVPSLALQLPAVLRLERGHDHFQAGDLDAGRIELQPSLTRLDQAAHAAIVPGARTVQPTRCLGACG